jgi:hypothetical protein
MCRSFGLGLKSSGILSPNRGTNLHSSGPYLRVQFASMTMRLLFNIYLVVFWIPAVASGIFCFLSWEEIRRPLLCLVWFVVALLLQATGTTFSLMWIAGLLLQAVLAIYLWIQRRLTL